MVLRLYYYLVAQCAHHCLPRLINIRVLSPWLFNLPTRPSNMGGSILGLAIQPALVMEQL